MIESNTDYYDIYDNRTLGEKEMENTTITIRYSIVTLVITIVLAILMTACGNKKKAPITVPEGAQPGELVGLESCMYKANNIEYAADCGTLVVPENRHVPNSRLIALPVTRIRSTGSNSMEPIFRFAGGPGGTNMKFPHLEGILENHEIVLVGYRGVDGSVVLQCPEIVEAVKGVDDDLLGKESLANLGNAWTRCGTRLQEEGVDLNGYTILEVVEDMETARMALGYDRINLLGQSYGTRVELFYAWMHPDSLKRVVMVAVNPPGHFVWEPDILDAQLRYDADLCARDPECSARTDNLAETMRKVVRNMPRKWWFFTIDPGKVRIMTHVLLFHRNTAATAYDAYLAAEKGDSSGLALMSLAYTVIPGMNTWGEAAAKAVGVDFDPDRDYFNDLNPPDSILGAPAAEIYWSSFQTGSWPSTPVSEAYRQVQPSDVEMLLVNGSIDYATPKESIDELLPSLSKAKVVILSEFGHTGDFWKLQPEARVHLLTTFFHTGDVDDSQYTYQPMDFHVGLGFPEIAKIALTIIIIVTLGLIALLWIIVRKLRRRRSDRVI